MEIIIIIILLVLFVALIVLSVRSHLQKSEKQKYYAAAGNILREEFLNYSLQNTLSAENSIEVPRAAKVMVYLKSKSTGKKAQFVFDPEKGINFGRDSSESNVFINDPAVSQLHCRVYSENDHVYLQDEYSSNGTFLKRGLTKQYALYDGNQIELQTGDTLIVGSSRFKICLFYYDFNKM